MVSDSTRTVANLMADYARARKTTDREQLFAYGAELALIDSLMLAKVGQAVDIATAEIRAERERESNRAATGDPNPWVSRRTGERGPSPDYFPESVLTYGVDYRPRAADALPLSEWGESRRDLLTPATIAANHALHVSHAAYEVRKIVEAVERGGWAGDLVTYQEAADMLTSAARTLLDAIGEGQDA